MKPNDLEIEIHETWSVVERAECYDHANDLDVVPLWHDELMTIKGKYYRVWSFIGYFTKQNRRIEFDVLNAPGMVLHKFEEVPTPTPEDGNVSVIKLNRDSLVRIDGYNYKVEEIL